MRRRWVRRKQENGLFFIALVCLLTLLAFGFKEQLFCLVYPGVSYISGIQNVEKFELCKLTMAFSSGYYGYLEQRDNPDISVENLAGARALLKEYELSPGELIEDEM